MGRYDPLVLWLALLSCALNLTCTICGFIPSQANTGFISRRQPNFQRRMTNFRGNNFGGRNFAGTFSGHYQMNFAPNGFPRVMGNQRGGNDFIRGLRPQHSYSRSQPGGSHGYSRRHIRDVASNEVTHKRVRRQAMTSSQESQHMTWNFHPDNRRHPVPQGAPSQPKNSPKVILRANGNSVGPPKPSIVAKGQVRPSIVKLQSRTNINPPYQVTDPQQAMLTNSRNSPIRHHSPPSASRNGLTNPAPTNSQTNNQNLANIGSNANFLLDNFFPQMQPGLLSLGDNPLMNLASPKNENGNAHSAVPKTLAQNHGSKATGPNQNIGMRNKPVLTAGRNRILMNGSQQILNNAAGVSASNGVHELHQQVLPGNENILQNLPGSPNSAGKFLNLQTDNIGGAGQSSTLIKQETFQPLSPSAGAVSLATSDIQVQNNKAQQVRLPHQHPERHVALHLPPNPSATMARVMNQNHQLHTGMVHNSGVHPQSRMNLQRGSKRVIEAHSIPGQGRMGENQIVGSLQMNTKNIRPHGTNQIPNTASVVQTDGNPASPPNSNNNPTINLGHASHRSMITPQLISNLNSDKPITNNMQNQVSLMTEKISQKAQSPALGILPPKQTMPNQRLIPNSQLKQTQTNQIPIPNLPLKQSLIDQRPIPHLPLKQSLTEQRPIPNLPLKHSLTDPRPIPNLSLKQSPIDQMPMPNMPLKQSPIDQRPILNLLLKQSPIDQRPIPNLPLKQSPMDQSPIPNLPLKQSPIDQRPILNLPLKQSPIDQRPLPNLPLKLADQRPIPNLPQTQTERHGIVNQDSHPNNMGAFNSILSGPGTRRRFGQEHVGLVHDQTFPLSVNQADIFQQIQGFTIKDLAKSNFTRDQILNALSNNFKTKDKKRQVIKQGGFKQNLGNGLAEMTTNPSLRIQNRPNDAPVIQNTAIKNQFGSSLLLDQGSEPILASMAELEQLQLSDITRKGAPAPRSSKGQVSPHGVLGKRTNSNTGKSNTFNNSSKTKHMSQFVTDRRHGGLSSNNLNTNLQSNVIKKDVLSDTTQNHDNPAHSRPQTRYFAGSSRNVKSEAGGLMLNDINSPHLTTPHDKNRINTFVQDKYVDIPAKIGMNNDLHQINPHGKTGLGTQVLQPNDGAGVNSIVPVQQNTLLESTGLHNTASFRQSVVSGRSKPKKQNTPQSPGLKPQLPGGVRVEHWLFSEMGTIMSSKAVQTTSTTTTSTTAPITTGRLLITQPNIPLPTAQQLASRNGRRPSQKIKTRGRRRRKKIRKRINRGRRRRILPSTTHAPRFVKASVDAINTTNTTNSKQDSRLKRRKINITKETRIVTRPIGPPVNLQTNVLLSQIMKELKKSATTPSPLNQDINHKLSQILDLLKTNSNPTNNPFGILATTAPTVDVLQLLGGAQTMPVVGASLGGSLGDAMNQGQQNQLSPMEMLLMSNILQGNGAPGQSSSLTQLLTGIGSNGAMTLGQNGTTPGQIMNSTLVQAMVQQMMFNNDNNNNGCGCYPKSLGCPNELFPRDGRRWKHLINCNKDETRCCDDN